ncbi:hypothetical protein HMPREF0293_2574 [Corynebacterium glucuronolyticum ATCC 51866]|uniref:Uncharacterized protein n=1 Tax=Corynebacterium glucuronolyticum ATCC 51866 TaxID=548478 RepID=A0ABM9XLK4_9CORY|nr:hypothetical protein HMPREF0293_2574 [Corynebacterium glucuronolyticum ATCC 51866]
MDVAEWLGIWPGLGCVGICAGDGRFDPWLAPVDLPGAALL